MMKKSNKNANRLFALKKLGESWLVSLVMATIFFILFKDIFPDIISFHSGKFKAIVKFVVLLLIYRSFNYYKRLMEIMQRSDMIYNIKKEPRAKERLESFLLLYEESIEITKQKLKNITTFSPIPIIIVSVEYFTNALSVNFMEIFTNITSFKFDFHKSELFALILFGAIIYYIWIYVTTWQKYKSSTVGYYDVARSILEISSKDNILKKK